MKNITIKPPPHQNFIEIPIVHKLRELYGEIYKIGSQISKRDKLGLHANIEDICIELIGLSVETALLPKINKENFIQKIRLKTEVLKHLIRASNSLKIIDDKKYIFLEEKLQEISKMANGWLKYVTQNPAQSGAR